MLRGLDSSLVTRAVWMGNDVLVKEVATKRTMRREELSGVKVDDRFGTRGVRRKEFTKILVGLLCSIEVIH